MEVHIATKRSFVFACGMTDHLDTFLQVLFGRLAFHQKSEFLVCGYPVYSVLGRKERHILDVDDFAFLESLQREIHGKIDIDIFHNKYANIMRRKDTAVRVPSRFYDLTSDIQEEIEIEIDESNGFDSSPADCTLTLRGEGEIKRKLNVLKRITNHQQVMVTFFDMSHFLKDPFFDQNSKVIYEEVMNLFTNTVRLSKEIELFRIEYVRVLPRECMYMEDQLKGCCHLGY